MTFKFKPGDRVRIKSSGEVVTVTAGGICGTLEEYIKINKLPFRYDDYNYRVDNDCHSHLQLDDFLPLTKLEKALK